MGVSISLKWSVSALCRCTCLTVQRELLQRSTRHVEYFGQVSFSAWATAHMNQGGGYRSGFKIEPVEGVY